MKMNTFGLDIGTTLVRAVNLRQEKEGFFLESIGVSPVDPKGILSESLVDQQGLADSIKRLLESASIKLQTPNIALPESKVFSRIIEMPDLSEQELSAALQWEMEQYIPLPLDQVQRDWQILGHREINKRKVMDVLIVAAPLKVIEKYEKILEMADLSPSGIETETVSVHRALSPLVTTHDPSLIVHMGDSTTDVIVVQAGIMQMVSSIGLGGTAVTRAVSQDLGVDVSKAEEYKRAYGLNKDALEGKVGKALNPVLSSIASDVKKAMFAFHDKHQSQEIKQILLSGTEALLPGVDIYFTNALNVQVLIGNVWKAHNITNVPDPVISEASSYDTVVGLALRDAS